MAAQDLALQQACAVWLAGLVRPGVRLAGQRAELLVGLAAEVWWPETTAAPIPAGRAVASQQTAHQTDAPLLLVPLRPAGVGPRPVGLESGWLAVPGWLAAQPAVLAQLIAALADQADRLVAVVPQQYLALYREPIDSLLGLLLRLPGRKLAHGLLTERSALAGAGLFLELVLANQPGLVGVRKVALLWLPVVVVRLAVLLLPPVLLQRLRLGGSVEHYQHSILLHPAVQAYAQLGWPVETPAATHGLEQQARAVHLILVAYQAADQAAVDQHTRPGPVPLATTKVPVDSVFPQCLDLPPSALAAVPANWQPVVVQARSPAVRLVLVVLVVQQLALADWLLQTAAVPIPVAFAPLQEPVLVAVAGHPLVAAAAALLALGCWSVQPVAGAGPGVLQPQPQAMQPHSGPLATRPRGHACRAGGWVGALQAIRALLVLLVRLPVLPEQDQAVLGQE